MSLYVGALLSSNGLNDSLQLCWGISVWRHRSCFSNLFCLGIIAHCFSLLVHADGLLCSKTTSHSWGFCGSLKFENGVSEVERDNKMTANCERILGNLESNSASNPQFYQFRYGVLSLCLAKTWHSNSSLTLGLALKKNFRSSLIHFRGIAQK